MPPGLSPYREAHKTEKISGPNSENTAISIFREFNVSKTIVIVYIRLLNAYSKKLAVMQSSVSKNNSLMDKNLEKWIRDNYYIESPSHCSNEEAAKVVELNCKEKRIESIEGLEKFRALEVINLSDNYITDLDFSSFPNLRKLDCSLNPIENLNLTQNHLLEEISYYGLRGNKLRDINFSGNPNLKTIFGGQDGLRQVDLSNNPLIEKVIINLSSHLRHLNVSKCQKLRYIRLWGVSVPYVDLTHNNNIEHVEINYLNTYKGKADVYGPGYPRPFIFVNDSFNKEVINKQDRDYEYYTHVLVLTTIGSKEEKVLQKLDSLTAAILSVDNVASFHYEILGLLNGEMDTLNLEEVIVKDDTADPFQKFESEPVEFNFSDVTRELQIDHVKLRIRNIDDALSLGQGEKLQHALRQEMQILHAIENNLATEKPSETISLNQQIEYARIETNQSKLESKQNRIFKNEFQRQAIIWESIMNYLKQME